VAEGGIPVTSPEVDEAEPGVRVCAGTLSPGRLDIGGRPPLEQAQVPGGGELPDRTVAKRDLGGLVVAEPLGEGLHLRGSLGRGALITEVRGRPSVVVQQAGELPFVAGSAEQVRAKPPGLQRLPW
jgi:hypothetical protein